MKSRTLTRPMFRIGGSAGTGITSGLDQPRQIMELSNDRGRRKYMQIWINRGTTRFACQELFQVF